MGQALGGGEVAPLQAARQLGHIIGMLCEQPVQQGQVFTRLTAQSR
jgi:hypothetical protein